MIRFALLSLLLLCATSNCQEPTFDHRDDLREECVIEEEIWDIVTPNLCWGEGRAALPSPPSVELAL